MLSLFSPSCSVTNGVLIRDLPGGPVVESPPVNVGDMGLIPDPGRFHMLWSN